MSSKFNDFLLEQLQDAEFQKEFEALHPEHKNLIIVKDDTEGGYVVSNPDLPGCITCGDTIESALANVVDARKAWIAAANADCMSASQLREELNAGYDEMLSGNVQDAEAAFAAFCDKHRQK